MVTCIINQFDFNAGIRGVICCILFGKLKIANAFINKVVGENTGPIKVLFVICSKKICIRLKLQDKNINDSYKQKMFTKNLFLRTGRAPLNAYGSNFFMGGNVFSKKIFRKSALPVGKK